MTRLEEMVDAHLEGRVVEIPEPLRKDFERAIAAHEAIRHALDETLEVKRPAQPGQPAAAADLDRRPPELPEDYEIVRELGRGGMGVVYLARQKSLGRDVAVKVLRIGEASAGLAIRRFLEEARHLARLRHPHIVAVHEIGRAGVCGDGTGGEPFFTMEYVEGESMIGLLAREGRLKPSRAVMLLREATEGVRHAHGQGLIHRDLKPGNILIDADGHAFVTDFGLARDLAGSSGLTRTGELMGTPAYMAPEQVLGQTERIGEATDIHALGAVLYEMLTGRPPYGNDSPARVLGRILDAEPVAPRRIDRRIPRDLETICLTALAKDPARRYATAAALLEDLRRFDSGLPPLARRPGSLERSWRVARRHWRTPALAAILTAILLGLWAALMPSPMSGTTSSPSPTPSDSAATMIAQGDAHHHDGRHDLAARFYEAALRRAGPDQRPRLLERLTECIDMIENPATALDVSLPVVELAPDISLGRHDLLVARVLASKAQEIGTAIVYDQNGQGRPDLRPEERDQLQVIAARLRNFLTGANGSETERAEIQGVLTRIESKLQGSVSSDRLSPYPPLLVLPEGSPEELRAQSQDTSRHPWERGKAAYAEALALEAAEESAAALNAYRRAFDLIRSVFPFYADSERDDLQTRLHSFASGPDLSLLREIVAAIGRLDPSTPEPLRGGLRFRIEGPEVPPEVGVSYSPRLHSVDLPADVGPANDSRGYLLRWDVRMQGGTPVWVGVADGRYRLKMDFPSKSLSASGSADDAANRFFSLLDLDAGDLPDQVEIRGNTVELPPIQARLLEEVQLLTPPNDVPFDLREDFFRWRPVEGAATYRLQVSAVAANESGTLTHFGFGGYETASTSLCLGVAPEQNGYLGKLDQKLRPGMTGEWHVEAFDAEGRKLGTTVGPDRTFVLARSLKTD